MDDKERSQQLVDSFAPLGNHPPPPLPGQASSFDKLSFSDVLQFTDFGPKLALSNQPSASHDDDDGGGGDDDDSYFFRFQSLPSLPAADVVDPAAHHAAVQEGSKKTTVDGSAAGALDHRGVVSETTTLVAQQQQKPDGGAGSVGQKAGEQTKTGRRKRPRSTKTSEEVESQRMTHIAVERNRRRQMNDYLRVLRSLMPGSYVQRGDQASIIGGAIEFIRELEQLIQCLESQKRRRLYGDAPARPATEPGAPPSTHEPPQREEAAPSFYPPTGLPLPAAASTTGDGAAAAKALGQPDARGAELREDMAESRSCVADVEVRALGADAVIKVLSRRRPEQLIRMIAALEDMRMSILHTNITTIEQTVLYSFNVKIAGEPRFSAEDIAGAVNQIITFIDVSYTL